MMEEYLFLKLTFDITSIVWEGSMLVVTLTGLLCFVILISATFLYGFDGAYFQWACVSMIVVLLVLLVAARANSAMTYIKRALLDAKPSDYKDIGTRQVWIDWTTSTRLVFTLFGLEITYSSLIGTAITIVSTLFVAILTSLL